MKRAEVTAFLSLIFILLVTFVGGIMESASIQMAKSYRRADMNRAMESVFAEYQKELLEEYDIFALEVKNINFIFKGGIIMRTTDERRTKSEKSFIDYAIWVDFPVNAGIIAYFIMKIYGAFQTGIDKALEAGFYVGEGLSGDFLSIALPFLGVVALVAFGVELLYLILRMSGKETYWTKVYATALIGVKLLNLLTIIIAIVVF